MLSEPELASLISPAGDLIFGGLILAVLTIFTKR
jgi:hypothetical protein